MYTFLIFLQIFLPIVIILIFSFINKLIIKKFLKPTHKVKLLTDTDGLSLRKQPDPKVKVYKKILNGTEIKQISIGDEVTMGEIKGNWVKIMTRDSISGWCFSGSLEKINEKDYVQNRNDISIKDKKCRNCNKIFPGSYNGCLHCGSSLFEEISTNGNSQNISQINPINKNYGDTWTCKKCNEINAVTSPTCKSCGEYK